MQPPDTVDTLKARGVDVRASDGLNALYIDTFATFGRRALWSSRPVTNPSIADLLAITESLRVEGGIAGRQRAEAIIAACRAAL